MNKKNRLRAVLGWDEFYRSQFVELKDRLSDGVVIGDVGVDNDRTNVFIPFLFVESDFSRK